MVGLKLSKRKSRGLGAGKHGETLGEILGLPVLVAPRGEVEGWTGPAAGSRGICRPGVLPGLPASPKEPVGPGLEGCQAQGCGTCMADADHGLDGGNRAGQG